MTKANKEPPDAAEPRRIFKPRFAKLAPNEQAIDRRSHAGNPFRVGDPGVPDRETATELYRQHLLAGTLRSLKNGRRITPEYLIKKISRLYFGLFWMSGRRKALSWGCYLGGGK
jgi:hypothetical protein